MSKYHKNTTPSSPPLPLPLPPAPHAVDPPYARTDRQTAGQPGSPAHAHAHTHTRTRTVAHALSHKPTLTLRVEQGHVNPQVLARCNAAAVVVVVVVVGAGEASLVTALEAAAARVHACEHRPNVGQLDSPPRPRQLSRTSESLRAPSNAFMQVDIYKQLLKYQPR